MSEQKTVSIPELGQAEPVEVIEVNVSVGETVSVEQTLITLESDKASMEIPAPQAGTVHALHLQVGDKVTSGDQLLTLLIADSAAVAEVPPEAVVEEQPASVAVAAIEPVESPVEVTVSEQPLVVPDIGTTTPVAVIEVNVAVGDQVAVDQTIMTLESDKASMELPSPFSGVVTNLTVAVGDQVCQGQQLGMMTAEVASAAPTVTQAPVVEAVEAPATASSPPRTEQRLPPVAPISSSNKNAVIHASPGLRRLAREFGVELSQLSGSGRKGRILRQDIQDFVKKRLNEPSASGVAVATALPAIDFSQFGAIEEQPLSRIKKLSAKNLHRNWVSIPHVTQFDEVDITEMEAFRQANKKQAELQGFKLTPLVFLLKAVVSALRAFPSVNASLSSDGETLILKKYIHIGVAVDTPQGLVVPVIRDVDQKGLFQLAEELGHISLKARDLKLTAKEMQGSCFTLSSLGGIGGTAFTPIINAPDVAILGVSKSQTKPVYLDEQLMPRLMLPLSLSYDHRVIDGAEAARFITHLGRMLFDIRQLLL